jgi:hypothetical protein
MNIKDIDYEIDDDTNSIKNDLSLFNELSRENYDPSELDDGADLTGKCNLINLKLIIYFPQILQRIYFTCFVKLFFILINIF